MLFTTTTEWVALALVFIAGWLFGLASHPGGRRWKARYADEREAHAAARKEHDARLTELQRRNTELERENGRLAPVAAAPVHREDTRADEDMRADPAVTGTRPISRRVIRPASDQSGSGERAGWFDWSRRT